MQFVSGYVGSKGSVVNNFEKHWSKVKFERFLLRIVNM